MYKRAADVEEIDGTFACARDRVMRVFDPINGGCDSPTKQGDVRTSKELLVQGKRATAYGLGVALAMLIAGPIAAVQIPLPPNSATGRTITPAYEGWYDNADGSHSLSFGYFNRNTDQVLEIPLGADNMLEPASLPQNQPTRFEDGRNWGTFVVRVPGDFGDREVMWTLKMDGQTFSVPGHLKPEWKIDALHEGAHDNTPPVLQFVEGGPEVTGPGGSGIVFGPLRTSVGDALDISVYANDDGAGRSLGGFGGFGSSPLATLAWFKHQGPGNITFGENNQRARDAEVAIVNTLTFSTAGQYLIRIRATDGGVSTSGHAQCCWTNGFVRVAVSP